MGLRVEIRLTGVDAPNAGPQEEGAVPSIRLDVVHPESGSADLVAHYAGKTARVHLEGLSIPEDAGTPCQPFYQQCLEELFNAIQDPKTVWRERPAPGESD